MSQYIGAIHEELYEYFLINDGFNIPQKLAQIEKTANKKYIEMTDVQLFNTIQELRKNNNYHQDQKLTVEEFNNWVNDK